MGSAADTAVREVPAADIAVVERPSIVGIAFVACIPVRPAGPDCCFVSTADTTFSILNNITNYFILQLYM